MAHLIVDCNKQGTPLYIKLKASQCGCAWYQLYICPSCGILTLWNITTRGRWAKIQCDGDKIHKKDGVDGTE